MKMKKIISILSIALIFTIFYACDDSLGYDPNVQVIPIYDEDSDTTVVTDSSTGGGEHSFVIDSMKIDFKEYYTLTGKMHDLSVSEWPYRVIRRIVRLDTGQTEPIIFFDITFENDIPDQDYPTRMDRLYSLRMRFLAELKFVGNDPLFFNLLGNSRTNNWLRIILRNIRRHQNLAPLDGEDIRSQMVFYSHDKVNKTINGMLAVDFSFIRGVQTKFLRAAFTVYYNEK